MSNSKDALEDLRRRIDAVDDAIHDLLLERTSLAVSVREAKGEDPNGYFRPSREAEILRRLVKRHTGPFPKPVLVRIWREIMAAMLRLQGPLSVAVYAPAGLHWYWDHAKEHFGANVPTTGHQSARSVVVAVGDGTATVGVLPLPAEDDADVWWPTLDAHAEPAPRIAARIPFGSGGSGPGDSGGALVLGRIAQTPTGDDRSFVCISAGGDVSRARLTEILTKAGLPPLYLLPHVDDPDTIRYLAEISDFVGEDDARVAAVAGDSGSVIRSISVLGGYAIPFGPGDLESDTSGARERES